VFEAYNTAVWPAQVVLSVVAVVCVALVMRGSSASRTTSLWILSALWLWVGCVYHFGFFTEINPMAWVFGAAFVVQALLFGLAASRDDEHTSTPRWTRALGWTLIAYALVVYPLLAELGDHPFPHSPTFGLPCPTTIFTFGILLSVSPAPPRWVAIIPVLWGVIGTSAAFSFGVYEDLGLGFATVAGMVGLFWKRR
jgi:hypothetical protein